MYENAEEEGSREDDMIGSDRGADVWDHNDLNDLSRWQRVVILSSDNAF
jgi:hypothetical protein